MHNYIHCRLHQYITDNCYFNMPSKTSVSKMEHDPKYNNVHQALVPFTRIMWLVGLYPIANNSIIMNDDDDDDQSVVNGLKFR